MYLMFSRVTLISVGEGIPENGSLNTLVKTERFCCGMTYNIFAHDRIDHSIFKELEFLGFTSRIANLDVLYCLRSTFTIVCFALIVPQRFWDA